MRRRRRPGDDSVRYAPRPDTPDVADPLAATEPLPPMLARPLRELYAAPDAAPYWDGLEARIMAAVRGSAAATTGAVSGVTGAMRAVPAAAAQWSTLWWQALARWTRPALAAAGVALVVGGAAFVQARATAHASRAHSAYRVVLGDPFDPSALPLPAPDPQLARAVDAFDPFEAAPGDTAGAAEARAARVAAELLSGGLVRRRPLASRPAPTSPTRTRAGTPSQSPDASDRQARREATFRYVMPER